MKANEKTNVMRVLDGRKIAYESHSYEADPTLSGEQIAGILGEDAPLRQTPVDRLGFQYPLFIPIQVADVVAALPDRRHLGFLLIAAFRIKPAKAGRPGREAGIPGLALVDDQH